MTNERIKLYFGRKRYYELRDQAFQEWLLEGKKRGVSTRHFINEYLKRVYDEELDRRIDEVNTSLRIIENRRNLRK